MDDQYEQLILNKDRRLSAAEKVKETEMRLRQQPTTAKRFWIAEATGVFQNARHG
jgi:hypothetical protein